MDADYFEQFKDYALNSKNYKNWRNEHTKVFGELFSLAFENNEDAQIQLTAALICISKQNFNASLPTLIALKEFCFNEFDEAVLAYFTGLNYEMMEKYNKMSEYYEIARMSNIPLKYPLYFHPYYRTAKFAQRKSECNKAIYYYQKALEFYNDQEKKDASPEIVSQIIYDVATIYTFIHKYEEAKKLIELSENYSSSENQHRDYISACLFALNGDFKSAKEKMNNMTPFLKQNCKIILDNIEAKSEKHYFSVPQDRSRYFDFIKTIDKSNEGLAQMLNEGKSNEAEAFMSNELTKTFSFADGDLKCRILLSKDEIIVKCKHYYSKTLMAEHEVLFSMANAKLSGWRFVSVDELENDFQNVV